ncbi:unnamed protein product [Ectocarpus sp. 12 AP-2014]
MDQGELPSTPLSPLELVLSGVLVLLSFGCLVLFIVPSSRSVYLVCPCVRLVCLVLTSCVCFV